MTIRLIAILFLTINSSCGLLGIGKSSEYINPDRDFQAAAVAEVLNRPIGKTIDSLIQKIDAAPLMIPNDLHETSLIIETYDYNGFLKVMENKLHTPKDDKENRRHFKRYTKNKYSLIKNPKHKIIYADKVKYDPLNTKDYKYVLKRTTRTHYDPSHLVVTNDGFVYPFSMTVLFYIYDRETHVVYKEITDLSILSKK
jgi:hypothetical protein